MLRVGRPSLAGILPVATLAFSAPDLSDLIGDMKPSWLTLGIGSGSLLALPTYLGGAVGTFISSVISDGFPRFFEAFGASCLSRLEVSGVANLAAGAER